MVNLSKHAPEQTVQELRKEATLNIFKKKFANGLAHITYNQKGSITEDDLQDVLFARGFDLDRYFEMSDVSGTLIPNNRYLSRFSVKHPLAAHYLNRWLEEELAIYGKHYAEELKICDTPFARDSYDVFVNQINKRFESRFKAWMKRNDDHSIPRFMIEIDYHLKDAVGSSPEFVSEGYIYRTGHTLLGTPAYSVSLVTLYDRTNNLLASVRVPLPGYLSK